MGRSHNVWIRTVLVAWLPVAVVATVLAATSFAVTQQVTRSSVDDVPRALAGRAADTLSRGGTSESVTSGQVVDLATDLGSFLAVYGANDTVDASTARLDGALPDVPRGVLAEARANGSDQVTWQPRSGVREAVIAIPWHSATAKGVVVAGASLRPSEDRQDQLLLLLLAGWLAAMAGSLAVTVTGVLWLGPGKTGPSPVRP